MDQIGDRIKEKRKEIGLTQTELGEKLGVTDRAVSKWETGESEPGVLTLAKLASVLEVSLDYLVLGKDGKSRPKSLYLSDAFVNKWDQENREGSYRRLAFPNEQALRRFPDRSTDRSLMDPFVWDVQKIQWCPYYNRYSGKTQVFALFENDDLTRRDIHVQHVAQIAKIIGRRLHLNEDLIEAIALAHDMGHTPFGHAGERILDKIYFEKTGRHFNHNIQSVRILTELFPNNISMQVLDGIAGHNGEEPLEKIYPAKRPTYDKFLSEIEDCYTDKENKKARTFIASTLEGLVVRYSDVIAYLISDRLDAAYAGLRSFDISATRKDNSAAISRLEADIIETSYGQDYIGLGKESIRYLQTAMQENMEHIYLKANDKVRGLDEMMRLLYDRLLSDLLSGNTSSKIFTHHIKYITGMHGSKALLTGDYTKTEPNQIVVDYIASMTDRYFIHLFDLLFPGKRPQSFAYTGYFD